MPREWVNQLTQWAWKRPGVGAWPRPPQTLPSRAPGFSSHPQTPSVITLHEGHTATHPACGFLCLGSGRRILGDSPVHDGPRGVGTALLDNSAGRQLRALGQRGLSAAMGTGGCSAGLGEVAVHPGSRQDRHVPSVPLGWVGRWCISLLGLL